MVFSMEPGTSCSRWLAQGSTDGWEVVSPDIVPRGMIVEAGESTAGVIPQLELHSRELSSL